MSDAVIKNAVHTINIRILDAEKKYHRINHSVTLLAVSKKQSTDKIRDAFYAGQIAFAENYVQEAVEKQQSLQDLNIEWHFIGTIQSNKIKLIAKHFSWVQSVDRLSVAEKLNRACEQVGKKLNVCIEVNMDDEKTSGVLPGDVIALAKKMVALKHLELRGLMIIPAKGKSDVEFNTAFLLQEELIQCGFKVDTLSMGMSGDFEAAIAAGSTMVRIGTALFGER